MTEDIGNETLPDPDGGGHTEDSYVKMMDEALPEEGKGKSLKSGEEGEKGKKVEEKVVNVDLGKGKDSERSKEAKGTEGEEDTEEDTTDEQRKAKEEDEVEEEEDENEERLNEPQYGRRPTAKEITAAYPGIFKKFPGLRDAYFREQKFTQYFPTLDDAEQAAVKAIAQDKLDESFDAGDPSLVTMVLDRKGVLNTFVDKLLPHLYEKNREAWHKVADPIVRAMLRAASRTGQQSQDNNLVLAARHLNRYLYGKYEDPQLETKSKEPDPELERLKDEKAQRLQRDGNNFKMGVHREARERIAKEISVQLTGIQKHLRPAIVDRIIDEVGEILNGDKEYDSMMKRYWYQAARSEFDASWGPRLISAYLGRARHLLPSKIRKYNVSESREVEDNNEGRENPRNRPRTTSQTETRLPPNRGGKNIVPIKSIPTERINYGKTSDMDLMNGKVTLK